MLARVYDITYCIEQDDLDVQQLGIASGLPSVLILEVDSEDDLADAISDKTGWLVEGFDFDIIN